MWTSAWRLLATVTQSTALQALRAAPMCEPTAGQAPPTAYLGGAYSSRSICDVQWRMPVFFCALPQREMSDGVLRDAPRTLTLTLISASVRSNKIALANAC